MDDTDPAAPPRGPLGTARLFCETCGEETLHRLLRVDGGGGRRAVAGVARCRVCRWTHPFVSARPRQARVELIVSAGPATAHRSAELPATALLRVGEPIPGGPPGALVRRLDLHDGRVLEVAPAHEVRTAWLATPGPPRVRVAVVEGARSHTEYAETPPGTRLEVGAALRLARGMVAITALRARQQTWRRPGDAFPADEVSVVYARRIVRPPAGRSPWRRARGTSRPAASSFSAASRSRSSPGVRRNRAAPRARIAAGGATESSSSSS